MLTRSAMRAILRSNLSTDNLLLGFLAQHFPAVERRLTDGMDRVRKENIVLEQLSDDARFQALLQGLAIRALAPKYRDLVESGAASLEDAQRWDRAASYGGGPND